MVERVYAENLLRDPSLFDEYLLYSPERISRKVFNIYRELVAGKRDSASHDSDFHYSITLTTVEGDTVEDLEARVAKLCKSKLLSPKFFEYSIEHEDTNVHAHVYLHTGRYVKARDVLRINSGRRIDIKKLKGIDVCKWRQYISKEVVPTILIGAS